MRKAMMLAAVLAVAVEAAQAGTGTITYQGYVLRPDGSAVADGSYRMRFRLFDAATAPTVGQMLRWNGTAWAPDLPTNDPPVAILQADPSTIYMLGESPASTQLQLSLSYDPEGAVITYALDPMGQNIGAPTSYGSAATTTVTYSEPGDYLAAGWVRDSAGAVSRAQALVSALRPTSAIPDSAGDVGSYASLEVVNGRPAIAYCNQTNWDLKYVRANDSDGTSWTAPVTPDSAGVVGQYASLAIVNGRPAIAYYNQTNGDLKYTLLLR